MHALLSTLLYAFFADTALVLLALALLAPYLCLYAIRRASNFFAFIGAHIGLVVWPLILLAIIPAGVGVAPDTASNVAPNVALDAASNTAPNAVPLLEPLLEPLPGAPLSAMLVGAQPNLLSPLRLFLIGCFIFMLIAAIHSIYLRLKGQYGYEVSYLIFAIAALTALSLISGYNNMSLITAANAIWAFIIIIGYLVFNQTIRIDESLSILSTSGRKPVNAILRFNNSILMMFLIPVVLFAAISPWLPLDRAARLLGAVLQAGARGLINFIRWIISLFGAKEPAEVPQDEPPLEQDMGFIVEEAAEPPAWMALLETIINVLIQLLIVGLIAAAIAYGIYKFYKLFIATRGKGGADEPDDSDTSEYIGPRFAAKPIAEAIGGFLRRFSPKSEADRVRRMYYKKVRRHIKRGSAAIRRIDTTGEIADKLRPVENIDELTVQYDRVRYGDIK